MTTIVTPAPTLDLAEALCRVKWALDHALTMQDPDSARDARTIADFLARLSDHHEVRALAARGRAVVRFLALEARRYG